MGTSPVFTSVSGFTTYSGGTLSGYSSASSNSTVQHEISASGSSAAVNSTVSLDSGTGTVETTVTYVGYVVNSGTDYPVVLYDGDYYIVGLTTHSSTAVTAQSYVFPVCYLPGSLIATPAGDIAVERLAAGDMVLTAHGGPRPITWIGTGKVLATRGRRSAATPVIVRKGALGDNVPYQDLRVTKGHSIYIDSVFIPAEYLVNHRSILWDDQAQEVTFYHVELDTHDVLLANGAPAESYRDDGNRWLFQNFNSGWHLPAKLPYAPVLTGGPIVDAIWRRLLDRAGPRTAAPMTEDPDVHLIVDGRRVDGRRYSGGVHTFRLAGRPDSVRIVSRAAAPDELGLARDPRSLGVGIRQISVWQGSKVAVVGADDAQLSSGFHDFEPENGLRWTNGDAEVPASLFAGFTGAIELSLHLGGATRYIAGRLRKRAA